MRPAREEPDGEDRGGPLCHRQDRVSADIVHPVAAEYTAQEANRHVHERTLQVRPAAGAEVDVIPPGGSVLAVPARQRDVVPRVDADRVIRQRDEKEDAVQDYDCHGRTAGQGAHGAIISAGGSGG